MFTFSVTELPIIVFVVDGWTLIIEAEEGWAKVKAWSGPME
jgi:hypothetical protein